MRGKSALSKPKMYESTKNKKRYDLPTSLDSDADFDRKKNKLMSKLIPTSVIPAATSNAFLILGATEKEDCQHLNLKRFHRH